MPRTQTISISDEVKDVLRRSTITADSLVLPPGQLDRKLYENVNTVLTILGGKWNRGRKAHVFVKTPSNESIVDVLADALHAGELVDTKKTLQQFFTPAAVADRLVELADLPQGGTVLEPSAGHGAIVKAIHRGAKDVHVTAVELDASCFVELNKAVEPFGRVVGGNDFLLCYPTGHPFYPFDAVIMNPPFTGGQDVEHVLHAYKFLKPGGRLVAIVSPGFRFRREGKFQEFKRLNDDVGIHEENLDPGTFKESGTNVATVVVVWEKPAAVTSPTTGKAA